MIPVQDQFLWTEKYRPQTIDECILPDRIKIPFKDSVLKGDIQHLLLSGGPGMGKTTVAKAMAKELGCDVLVINGSDENGIDLFRNKIKHYASSLSLTGGKKIIIIDEADYLNANSVQPALRSAMEEFASNCVFIFTCNYKTKIIAPLHSRCVGVDFTLHNGERKKMAAAFFKRVQLILTTEQVEFDNAVVAELITKYFPDFRRVLNELQRYAQFGKIDVGVLAQNRNRSVKEMIGFLKRKDFTSVRKWVASTRPDSTTIWRTLYDELFETLKPVSIPHAVVFLGDYQYKSAFVVDQEINLVACLSELMYKVEFL